MNFTMQQTSETKRFNWWMVTAIRLCPAIRRARH